MPHTVSVDLSAKTEQWTKDSAVAFSDGIQGSMLVRSRVKQQARRWLERRYPNRRSTYYTFLMFALMVYLLIEPHLDEIEHVVIDQDYPGKENEGLIKDFLLNFLHNAGYKIRGRYISFREVRGSQADVLAREIYRGREKPDRRISLSEIQQLFK